MYYFSILYSFTIAYTNWEARGYNCPGGNLAHTFCFFDSSWTGWVGGWGGGGVLTAGVSFCMLLATRLALAFAPGHQGQPDRHGVRCIADVCIRSAWPFARG